MYKESEGESGGESRYVSLNICILCHLSEKEKIEREGNNSNKSKEGEREGGYMSTAHYSYKPIKQ